MSGVPSGGTPGLLIAAPSSGAGKTTVTLGLLRALVQAGVAVSSAKSGPDYIDPKFHEAASGRTCVNLDAFAMEEEEIRALADETAQASALMIIEGAMGLFDGAANGRGSAADLAAILGAPVVLVVDCARQSQSVAALVHGFVSFRSDITIAGVILNRVGSARHEAMLRAALRPSDIPVFGAIPRDAALGLPDRHLGLVQAGEHGDLEAFLDQAGLVVARSVDLSALQQASQVLTAPSASTDGAAQQANLPLPGPRIAVARDIAFAFSYPHVLRAWQRAGAELSFFSPLADEAPDAQADCIFLPGGYPELHARTLAEARTFKAGVSDAAARGVLVYGECGGYMTLGESLIDATGEAYPMLGMLPLVTSFAERRRHLGYRVLQPKAARGWLAGHAGAYSAHEFHYATIVREGPGDALFAASDAEGNKLADMGLRRGNVMGSFAHLISSRADIF